MSYRTEGIWRSRPDHLKPAPGASKFMVTCVQVSDDPIALDEEFIVEITTLAGKKSEKLVKRCSDEWEMTYQDNPFFGRMVFEGWLEMDWVYRNAGIAQSRPQFSNQRRPNIQTTLTDSEALRIAEAKGYIEGYKDSDQGIAPRFDLSALDQPVSNF